MTYKVKLQETAKNDITGIIQYIELFSDGLARKWRENIKEEIKSLQLMPYRFALAPEEEELRHDIHQLVFGAKTSCYRIIYRIDEELKEVRVLTVRHASRKMLEIEDL